MWNEAHGMVTAGHILLDLIDLVPVALSKDFPPILPEDGC